MTTAHYSEILVVGRQVNQEALPVGGLVPGVEARVELISAFERLSGLPYEDGRFTYVLLDNASELLSIDEPFLAEIRRVTQPQGRLLVVDLVVPGSHLRGKTAQKQREAGRYLNAWHRLRSPEHIEYLDAGSWKHRLLTSGWNVEEIATRQLDCDFESWTAPFPLTPARKTRLRAMLVQAPEKVAAFLTPSTAGDRIAFRTTEIKILARLVQELAAAAVANWTRVAKRLMSKKYHFWITGCQMNYADARRVASELEKRGYETTAGTDDADVIILQTCTVRQQSEDKAYNKLHNLRHLKEVRPDLTVAVMGCVVGVRGNEQLERQFPFVDVFMEPSTDGAPLISHLTQDEDYALEQQETAARHALQDGQTVLPDDQRGRLVSAPVAIVYGCSHACTFCIIPQKRGRERSRPVGEIAAEVRSLVRQGVKEVVLLGQIVDRYGYDVPDGPDLADLLAAINGIDGLQRIRFLTSHPSYMTTRILQAVADLPKVMPQIEIPIQAGDNTVLQNMKRGYTREQYRDLIHQVRDIVPDAAIHGDIIVGFPGETAAQFQQTVDILSELRLDKIHLARYSPRPGTVSARTLADDVSEPEKRRRFHVLESLQKEVSQEKMRRYLGTTVVVLVEEKQKDRWRGRTPQNKLVFFSDPRELRGELVAVEVTHAGPWSMSGKPADRKETVPGSALAPAIPLPLLS